MVPVEADGGFDPAREMRGSGPWTLTSYTPSVAYEFAKNPDFYVQGRPFLDSIRSPIIPEYSTGISNLQAGNLDLYVGTNSVANIGVRAEDVVELKKNQPRLVMFSQGFNPSPPQIMIFSQRPNNPFLDDRVRKAMSMLLERELWAETFYNIAGFKQDGIDIDWAPNTTYGAGQTKYWVDPRGDGLGSAGKYFNYDPAEARKLLQAAGHNNPIKSKLQVIPERSRFGEVLQGMLSANNDFQLEIKVLTVDENRQIHTGKGDFEGLSLQAPGSGGDIDVYFSARFIEGASGFVLWEKTPHPKLQELLVQQRTELDDQKRTELIRGPLQKEFAETMPVIPYPSIGAQLNITQPWIRNLGAIFGMGSNDAYEVFPNLWYDATKA